MGVKSPAVSSRQLAWYDYFCPANSAVLAKALPLEALPYFRGFCVVGMRGQFLFRGFTLS